MFSDLAKTRNYQWKNYLAKSRGKELDKKQDKFSMQFIFDQISNDNLTEDLRSAFANLSMTLYIDHEPLNEIIVPKKCRIIDEK